MKKCLAFLLIALMLCASFAGCSSGSKDKGDVSPADSGAPFGTFRSYFTASPTSLSRFSVSDTESEQIVKLTSLHLYNDRVNEDGTGWIWYGEGAAEMPIKMDEEGKVWQIKVREGVTWQNGDPLTADDWIYTFKMYIDPDQYNVTSGNLISSTYFDIINTSEYQNMQCEWEDVGVKKIDNYTFEITGTYGVPEVNIMRYLFSLVPVHEPTFEKGLSSDRSAALWGTDLNNYMSCGAFILTEWIKDGKFVLERNPNYIHADDIKIECIEYRIVPTAATALQLFKSGELDYCSLSFADWEEFEDDPRVYEYFNDSLMYFFVNLGNPNQNGLLGNLDFRQALNHAADRVAIADTIGGFPASRLVRRAVQANELEGIAFVDVPQDYVPDPTTLLNIPLANQYLTKAYEQCSRTSANMEILLNQDSSHIKTAVEMIQQQFQVAFGDKLTVTIRGLPATQTYSLRRWNPDDPDAFDTAFGSVLPSATDCRATFKFYTTDMNPPQVYHSNPEYDAWYKEAEELDIRKDTDRIVQLCQQMEKYVIDNLIVIPVYEIPTKVLFDTKINLPADGYIIGFGFGEKFMTISK